MERLVLKPEDGPQDMHPGLLRQIADSFFVTLAFSLLMLFAAVGSAYGIWQEWRDEKRRKANS